MARVSIEDCQKKLANRFALTMTAAHRARQLLDGQDPLVKATNKEAVIALREIAEGLVTMDKPMDQIIAEHEQSDSNDQRSLLLEEYSEPGDNLQQDDDLNRQQEDESEDESEDEENEEENEEDERDS